MSRESHEAGSQARATKVLAVASGGGHWVQLLRVTAGLDRESIVYVSTLASYAPLVAPARLHCVADANRTHRLKIVLLAVQMLWILLRERPDVVLTTGAACGFMALRLGRFLGTRTIWLDSIANHDVLSMSGQRARAHADLFLTQWPHLARPDGPHFRGAVL